MVVHRIFGLLKMCSYDVTPIDKQCNGLKIWDRPKIRGLPILPLYCCNIWIFTLNSKLPPHFDLLMNMTEICILYFFFDQSINVLYFFVLPGFKECCKPCCKWKSTDCCFPYCLLDGKRRFTNKQISKFDGCIFKSSKDVTAYLRYLWEKALLTIQEFPELNFKNACLRRFTGIYRLP